MLLVVLVTVSRVCEYPMLYCGAMNNFLAWNGAVQAKN